MSEYQGGECQQKHIQQTFTLRGPKQNHKITFHNAEGHEVGAMDFNGPGLSFEGVADESAIVFMDFVSKQFQARLIQEYDRGYKDGKASK